MDKEQIIINGVNVSGCKCYNKNIKTDCLLYPLQPDACKNNPNCYFKQLARKTQECEELKNNLKPLKNGEFCNHECNVCVHKDDVYTSCSNIRKIRQEQFNEPKVKFVEIKGQPYLKIPDKTVEMLKIITDKHLLYVAQAVVDEMEARGYGSKKS